MRKPNENPTAVKIDLSEVPPDRLARAFGYLAKAMVKQPISDFEKTDKDDIERER